MRPGKELIHGFWHEMLPHFTGPALLFPCTSEAELWYGASAMPLPNREHGPFGHIICEGVIRHER